jgi:hypothetical protein
MRTSSISWSKVIEISIVLGLTVLGGWWFLGQSLAERPTGKDVHDMITEHSNSSGHPSVMEHLQKQQSSIDRLEVKVDNIGDGLTEMKNDLKAIRRHQ